ncbi:hypothetical protein GGF41_008249, partial [Coemansia sp. RSA 2531]
QQQRQPNGGSIMRSPLPNSHQANQNQLVYTPSLLSRGAGAADADDFFLDSLPTSATSPRIAGGQTQQARNRTLHQLNASPSFASSIFGNGSVPPAPQRSVSLNSAALAMLSSNGMEAMQTDDDPMITAEQFNSWIEDSSRPPATAPIALRDQQQAKRESGTLSSAAGRRRSRTSLLSPRQTPLVPSTLKNVSSPGFSPHSMASPGLAPLTPATLAPRRIASSQATPNMGPMTSGSVTPQMRPRAVIAATSTTNIVGLEADVVTRLATKSNYQNIMEGNSEFLGLKYKTEFKSGLERRRTNHKQAEQKRRDSLKT